MKKDKRELFLQELSETPIVSIVCKRVGLSRQTIYRWCTEDEIFRAEFNLALSRGRDSINDLCESKTITNINKGDQRAIEFWLKNKKSDYLRPRPVYNNYLILSELDKNNKVTKEIINLDLEKLKEGLKLEDESNWRAKYAPYSDEELIEQLREAKKKEREGEK